MRNKKELRNLSGNNTSPIAISPTVVRLENSKDYLIQFSKFIKILRKNKRQRINNHHKESQLRKNIM